jgi:hypothetical protein
MSVNIAALKGGNSSKISVMYLSLSQMGLNYIYNIGKIIHFY